MIGNDQWNIPKGQYPVALSVDRTAPVMFTGEADGCVASVWWKMSADEVNLVSYGATLHATADTARFDYRLAGSAEMLNALGRCAGARLAAANPFAGA